MNPTKKVAWAGIALTLIIITTNAALAAETTNPYEWGTWGRDSENSFYQPYGTPYNGNYTFHSTNIGSSAGALVWDTDNDYQQEIIIRAGNSIRILNYTLGTEAIITSGSIGTLEIQENACQAGLPAIITLTQTQIKKYCYNQTSSSYYEQSNQNLAVNANTNTGMKCDDAACYFASTTGVEKCPITSNGFGTCTNVNDLEVLNATTNMVNVYAPPIKDIDADPAKEVVFICNNGTAIGAKIYNDNLTPQTSCFTPSPYSDYTAISRNILISDVGQVVFSSSKWIAAFDSNGVLQNTYSIDGISGDINTYYPEFITNRKDTGRLFVMLRRFDNAFRGIYVFTSQLSPLTSAPLGSAGANTDSIATAPNLRTGTADYMVTATSIYSYTTSITQEKALQGTIQQYEYKLIVDANRDGYLDIIRTADGFTYTHLTQGTPAPPPTTPQPTFNYVYTNATNKRNESTYTLNSVIKSTGETLLFNFSTPYNATWTRNCLIVFDYDDNAELPYTDLDTYATAMQTAGKASYYAPCPVDGYATVSYTPTTTDKAYRTKYYIWDAQHINDFNGVQILGNPSDGYVLLTNKTNLATLAVSARNPATNSPIPNVRVNILEYYRDGQNRVVGYTANNGDSAYFLLPEGTYTAQLLKNGYVTTTGTCTTSTTCIIDMPQGTTNYTVQILVRDGNSYSPLQNANVTILTTGESKLTDTSGIATFNLQEGAYSVRATKTGYYAASAWIGASELGYIFDLFPEQTGATNLVIETRDKTTLQAIPFVEVKITDPLTGYEQQLLTNLLGQAEFNNIPAGTYTITTRHENYKDGTYTATAADGTTTNRVVYLEPYTEPASTISVNTTTGTLTGQTICNGLWIPQLKDVKCTQNSDCVTGLCDASGHCSTFNWTWCDANGRPRNQRCVAKATAECGLETTTNWMLSNFLWVIVISILVVFTGYIVVAFRKK